MKSSLLALALVAALPQLAHADGVFSSVDHEDTAPHAAASYLQLGSTLGGDDDGMWLAGTLDGGRRLSTTPLWAHAQLAFGAASGGWDGEGQGNFESARVGLEVRAVLPRTRDIAAVYAGFDVGYQTLGFADEMSSSVGGMVAVGRFGLDIGSTHVRFRPGVDLSPEGQHLGTFALNAALAYQW